MNYYNDSDPKACAWLRQLIKDGLIPDGEVDERSITEVDPDDVRGFDQCHFFCGIAGWPLALSLAGLQGQRGIWTGSCPCQPFSTAGQGKGTGDKRHLWPEFYRLIEACQPDLVFGEQVAGKKGLEWLDTVCDDLEGGHYSAGATVVPACSVGAPHKRSRLYWSARRLANGNGERSEAGQGRVTGSQDSSRQEPGAGPRLRSPTDSVANTDGDGREGRIQHPQTWEEGGSTQRRDSGEGRAPTFWDNCEWVACRDGKARPIEPGTPPLAYGLSERVGLLRGYGNAIVPQLAAAFIEETLKEMP